MTDPQMSDSDRKKLEEALAAALLLIYMGKAKEALAGLHRAESTISLNATERAKIDAYATDRAQKVQDGINQYIQSAIDDLPDGYSQSDYTAAINDRRQEIDKYNNDVLMPFLTSWASHQGLVTALQSVPADSPDEGDGEGDSITLGDTPSGKSAADATLWQWFQYSSNPDDCADAAGLGATSLDDILSVTQGPPPRHERCGCDLTVV